MAPKYLNKLQGQRVVAIGGTKGIGYAVAEACVEFGATITVASSSQDNVDKAVKQLKTSYPDAADRINGHIVDLASDNAEKSIRTLFDFASNGGKDKLDHIVETAGRGVSGIKLPTVTSEELATLAQARYNGTIFVAKVANEYLKKEYTSSLTITSGVLVYRPMEGMSMGLALGGAKETLTRGLAVDMKPIRVNLIVPGAIKTELLLSMGPADQAEALLQRFAAGSLLNRVGEPEDMGELYVTMMKCHFITGTVVTGDGGFLLK